MTYRSLICALMKALAGSKQRVITPTPPLKRFGDPDVRNSQYVFSGADGGSVGILVRQIPLSH